MAKTISVLFVASEIFPYVKFGGVADFSFSFSLALRGMGHDVRVMMPRYGSISERKHHIHFIKRLQDIPLKIADREELITVKSSAISNARYKVQSYITTNLYYFDQRKGIYFDPQTGLPFPDNDERFILFSRSVVETCLLLNWFPEIIHCNDWQTGLVPVIAKTLYPNKFRKTRFVFTVHNFANQGEFPETAFEKTGLPQEIKDRLLWNGKFNFLKAGITYSDYVTTVSPTYAEEVMQNPEISSGLNEILLSRNNNFCGIMNGIDPWQWNPRFDNDISCTLSNSNFESYKICNKQDLLKSLGVVADINTPIIGMISHIEENKGIKLLIRSLNKLMKEKIILILLGTGKINLTKQLENLSQKYPGKFIFKNIYDESLAHKIEAGSDIFLMPSIYEPCGYNAIYSIIYGTVPIVRATGGLLDSVEQFNPQTKRGTGFFFNEQTPTALVQTVKEVLNYFNDKEMWKTIVSNCLQEQFLWKDSIDRYVEIYRQLLKT